MKVKVTGITDTGFEKIAWDDLRPCEKHGKNLECPTFNNRFLGMKVQNACIDLMDSKSKEEILKIWSEMDRWHNGFTKIHFWPNPEQNKNSRESDIANLEIIHEDEDDIKAMNQCLYDILRRIAYDENDHLQLVENQLKAWAKGLRDDIKARFQASPVSLKEYIEIELECIWQDVARYEIVNTISFKSLVDEELERIKRGKDLISGKELIQNLYKRKINTVHLEFHSFLFMNRIIASDIAQIILDLETGKFFPDCSPPYFIKPIKHEVYLKLQDELYPDYINKVGFWTGDKIDCARLIVTLEHLDLFKSDVTQLEIRKYFGLRFYNDENGLMDQLKKSKRPKYSKSEVKKWKFYNVLSRLRLI